jgi:hypothetical protein
MQREGRLADTAFMVEERDDHGATSMVAACPCLPDCARSRSEDVETTAARCDVWHSRPPLGKGAADALSLLGAPQSTGRVSKNPKDSMLAKLGARFRQAAPELRSGLGS